MGIVKTLNGSGSDSLCVFSLLMVLLMFLVHLPNIYLKVWYNALFTLSKSL